MRTRNVLFYPEYPDSRAAICRVIYGLGYNITNNPRQKYDFAFYWQDSTFREENQFLRHVARRCPVINYNCRDISKETVENAFQEAFGYGSFVDPMRHSGVCVRKSDLNAKHDGKVILCPIQKPEEGFIYQKLLEHIDENDLVVDYRVAVFGDLIGYCKLRYKKLRDRFAHTIRETVVELDEYLSEEEQASIIRFCKTLGMDYGELDMIRNQDDGRLYILDANNTPFRPPPSFNVPDEDRELMVQMSIQAFQKSFLDPRPKRVPARAPSRVGV